MTQMIKKPCNDNINYCEVVTSISENMYVLETSDSLFRN